MQLGCLKTRNIYLIGSVNYAIVAIVVAVVVVVVVVVVDNMKRMMGEQAYD